MKAQIAACCKALRLSQNLAERCDRIQADTREEYLLRLLEQEVAYREKARQARYLRQAGFYTVKTLEGSCFEEIRLPSSLDREALQQVSFLRENRNLILYGNVGTGKTHLAIALGVAACQQGKSVRFFRTAALVNQLGEAQKRGELSRFLKQLAKAQLIICDEWGYVPLDREGSQLLFQVISDCYAQRSVIITTNLEFSKWVNTFFDEQMTAAMIDRLVHHSHLLLFEGSSYRIRNSSMRGHS